MEVIVERVAGIDIGKRIVVGCVRTPGTDRPRTQATRTFKTYTGELHRLRAWLAENQVTLVVMEATGVYWQPVWHALTEPLPGPVPDQDDAPVWEVKLVNAEHVKRVPGRKTDVKDAEWLAQLAECGLLRGSFVPPQHIRELRDLTRYRTKLVGEHTRETQRLHNVLEDAQIKLSSVVADTLGVSARAMLRALVAGERDPEALADLAQGRMRPKKTTLSQALLGRFNDHHALMTGLILDHLDDLDRIITHLDEEIERVTRPFAVMLDLLDTIPGVGPRTAQVILAETGGDMTQFPTAAQLASWAAVCPGNHESAGKHKSGRTRRGNPYLRAALVQAAWAASHTKNSYLGAQFWRLARGHREKRAALAVAHSILVIAWHLMATGEPYTDLGGDYFARRIDQEAHKRRLIHQLENLGLHVTVQDPAA